jgi:hypothetical protein
MIFLCSLAKTSKNKSCQVANGGREEKVKEEGWMGWEKTLFAGSLRKPCMVRICKREVTVESSNGCTQQTHHITSLKTKEEEI